MTETLTETAVVTSINGYSRLIDELILAGTRQRQLIAEDRYAELVALLATRQQMANQLSILVKEIRSWGGEWERAAEVISPDTFRALQKQARDSGARLADLLKSDEIEIEKVRTRTEEIKAQLQGVPDSRSARNGYSARTSSASSIDIRH